MRLFEIFTVFAVGVAMSLAHVLEYPGKRRLDREIYLAVQTIYYPGFTFAGFSEVIGILLIALHFWLFHGTESSRRSRQPI